MRYSTILVLALAAVCVSGCSTPSATPSGRPVLLRLEGRQHTIVITAAPGGPRYSMKDASGRIIFADLDRDQLRARHPNVLEQLDSTLAAKDAIVTHDRWPDGGLTR